VDGFSQIKLFGLLLLAGEGDGAGAEFEVTLLLLVIAVVAGVVAGVFCFATALSSGLLSSP